MAQEQTGARNSTEPPAAHLFGLHPSRVRGALALLLIMMMLYAFVFESDPPPSFKEVDVIVPEQPQIDFDERTIVLPEFEESPLPEETAPADNVAIAPVEPAPAPAVEAAVEAVAAPAEEAAAAPAAPPAEPEPPSAAQTDVGAAPPGFFVQVAAFKARASAEELLGQLEQVLEVEGYIQVIERGGSELHRVRLGPFGADEAQAREVLSRFRQYDAKLSENAFVDEV